MDPAITLFSDFNCFCHFELEQISDEDPAITFFSEFDRFCHVELEQIRECTPRLHFLMTWGRGSNALTMVECIILDTPPECIKREGG